MGKTVALDPPALAWAHRQFHRYYAEFPVDPPPRLARREFASFPFAAAPGMRRHTAFREPEAFRDFLVREAPRHVYYSSAYYREPDRPSMGAKEWLGADVVFDLDADHLRGADRLDYAGQLALVKERVRALFDDFLVGDFGIDPAAMALVFSGGRGYHVHVRDPRLWPLTSPERRELVEYIQGAGFDPADAVRTQRDAEPGAPLGEGGGGAPRPRSFRRLYPPTTPGWRGRTTRSLLHLLARWDDAGADAAAAEMTGLGLAPREARHLARALVTDGAGRRIRDGLSLDVFPRSVPKGFLETVLRHAAIEVQGETDAPVTTDIHRLIRLPGSLHGGTGFRVRPLARDELDAFDPWRDAPIPFPDDATSAVDLAAPVAYPFPGVGALPAGGRVTLPTAVALFLVLRGEARPPPGAG